MAIKHWRELKGEGRQSAWEERNGRVVGVK
jgi:hypothetical protein